MVDPNCTPLVPRKLKPLMVTEVPPPSGPASGDTLDTDGRLDWLPIMTLPAVSDAAQKLDDTHETSSSDVLPSMFELDHEVPL